MTLRHGVLALPTAAVVLAASLSYPARGSGHIESQSDCQGKIVGTWRLVSAKFGGKESPLAKETITLKHVTGTHFTWMSYDGGTGQISRTGGGTYTLTDKYTERAEYGFGKDFEVIKGKEHAFSCRVEGNNWHHTGALANGLEIVEVWQLVMPAGR